MAANLYSSLQWIETAQHDYKLRWNLLHLYDMTSNGNKSKNTVCGRWIHSLNWLKIDTYSIHKFQQYSSSPIESKYNATQYETLVQWRASALAQINSRCSKPRLMNIAAKCAVTDTPALLCYNYIDFHCIVLTLYKK